MIRRRNRRTVGQAERERQQRKTQLRKCLCVAYMVVANHDKTLGEIARVMGMTATALSNISRSACCQLLQPGLRSHPDKLRHYEIIDGVPRFILEGTVRPPHEIDLSEI